MGDEKGKALSIHYWFGEREIARGRLGQTSKGVIIIKLSLEGTCMCEGEGGSYMERPLECCQLCIWWGLLECCQLCFFLLWVMVMQGFLYGHLLLCKVVFYTFFCMCISPSQYIVPSSTWLFRSKIMDSPWLFSLSYTHINPPGSLDSLIFKIHPESGSFSPLPGLSHCHLSCGQR